MEFDFSNPDAQHQQAAMEKAAKFVNSHIDNEKAPWLRDLYAFGSVAAVNAIQKDMCCNLVHEVTELLASRGFKVNPYAEPIIRSTLESFIRPAYLEQLASIKEEMKIEGALFGRLELWSILSQTNKKEFHSRLTLKYANPVVFKPGHRTPAGQFFPALTLTELDARLTFSYWFPDKSDFRRLL